MTRSIIKQMDCNKCIICQEDKREHLRLVSSDEMDATTRDLDEYDNKFHVRLSGVSHDLSAAEAKYNSSFIVRVSRQKLKTSIWRR